MRRAGRHLRADETLIASAVGLEPDGRRRQVVMVTDRRLLVAAVDGTPALELGLETASAIFDAVGRRLTLRQGQELRAVLRHVEPADAAQIVATLADHRPLHDRALAPRTRHVHLCPDRPKP